MSRRTIRSERAWTDEGYRAGDWDVIREGKLAGFALSQYGANKTGGVRAACPVKDWLCWTHIPAGDKTLDEIVSGITFDFCYLYNSSLDSAASFLRSILGDPAAIGSAMSSIASREAKTNEALKKVTDAYRTIAG